MAYTTHFLVPIDIDQFFLVTVIGISINGSCCISRIYCSYEINNINAIFNMHWITILNLSYSHFDKISNNIINLQNLTRINTRGSNVRNFNLNLVQKIKNLEYIDGY